jgi:hypothetical protein
MISKKKLYRLTSKGFLLPFSTDYKHQVIPQVASDMPMIYWPDGKSCFPANIYMFELYGRGLSRTNRGGTLVTYAANISHLIRYCYSNEIHLPDLTNAEFSLFIKMLSGERKRRDPTKPARKANSIIAIGRQSLDFIDCVARLYQKRNHVGPDGTIIAEKREYMVRREGSGNARAKAISRYWHHNSFPLPGPDDRRHAISTHDVRKIEGIIHKTKGSNYKRKRRLVTVKLLDITGGRRSEVAAVSVMSVNHAASMTKPMLKLLTAKQKGGREMYRYVPIARHDIAFLQEFIEVNRSRIIRRTCGHAKDDGFLLVNERTGRRLCANTITAEVHFLARSAGLTESKPCPHMYRHRYITKLFVALIEQHEIMNKDDFRRNLLDAYTFKQKMGLPVIEWVKIDHFSIKAWATCRSEPSSEGIPRRATRTIGAG